MTWLTSTLSDFQLGLLSFPILLILIFLRLPLAVAMLVVGLVGKILVEGQINGAQNVLKQQMFTTFSSYTWSLIPLFLLMSEFATKGGMSASLFKAAEAFLGRRKGGLAMAAIGASAGFGAICGSSLATASTMGRVALPELQKAGYSGGLATGALAAGGTLGILIPPSIVLVIFGILAEANIERLFLAAVLPALIAVLGYMITASIYTRLNQGSETRPAKPWFEDSILQAPRLILGFGVSLICVLLTILFLSKPLWIPPILILDSLSQLSWLLGVALVCLLLISIFVPLRHVGGRISLHVRTDRLNPLIKTMPVLLIFTLVFGGIYSGVFSPTAAAGIGAGLTFVVALIVSLRGKERNVRWISEALIRTCKTSAAILFIVVAAGVFNSFLASAQVPQTIARFFDGSDLSPWLILAGMLLLYLILGTVMDSLAMIFLTVPIFIPILLGLDFGLSEGELLIWFGILVLMSAEVGLITPPVGLNLFVINAMSDRVNIGETYRGVLPFVISDILRIILLAAFPAITLLLVRLIY